MEHDIASLSENTASVTNFSLLFQSRGQICWIFPKNRTTTSVATKTVKLNQDHWDNNVTVYLMVTELLE